MQPATNSGQALQNLQSFQQNEQTPTQELNTANQQFGVSQAQQTVQGLQGAINNTTNLLNQVAPSVEGRTQNSLVTSAQADKQISNEEAPIQSNLSQDEQGYESANSNYTNLEQEAENEANANIQSQDNQLSYLQNVYNDLYTQEQNQTAQQEAQQQAAQQQSEFQQSLAAEEGAGAGAGTLGNILGGASGAGLSGPTMANKGGGAGGGNGYAFTDASGKAISAATYAQQSGTPLGIVLQEMAQSGDTYAANAYADYQKVLKGGNPGAIANVKRQYSAIFWGT